jgi:hypothetical protein
MSASYPGAVKTFTSRSAGQTIASAHINDLQDEVTAIESGLLTGTAPIASSNASVNNLAVAGNSSFASSTMTIGTVPYIWPSSGGVVGQVLTIASTNGSTLTLAWSPSGSAVFDRQSSLVSVANTTTVTDVYTFAVPSLALSSNKTLHLSLIGDHLIATGAPDSVKAIVKYGATTALSFTAASVSNGVNRGALMLDVEISAAGVTNAQRAKGTFLVGDSAQNNAGGVASNLVSVNSYFMYGVHNNIAEDASTVKNLVVSFQCGTANSSIDMRVHSVYTEVR